MTTREEASIEEYDVIIIGAGISGISAAYHLQSMTPGLRYCILERRAQLGGTWDLFHYPGIRSDSDMYTFGFSFRPWQSAESKIIVPKEEILQYLQDTVAEYDMDRRIRYGMYMQKAEWSSQTAQWTVTGTCTTETTTQNVTFRAQYIFLCTGYYNYDQGYAPHFPSQEKFQGPIIHPQHWPTDGSLDYSNKRVVVIGSGATAVTLIPAMTQGPKAAQHVTMVQRSPTYLVSKPAKMNWFARLVASLLGHYVTRWYFALNWIFEYQFCQLFPRTAKKALIGATQQLVGDEVFCPQDFTPRYDPWDQRLCLCPDGDFLQALRSKRASIVTDHIVEFTKTGVRLQNAQKELPADIIVTATGLKLLFGGGMKFVTDDKPLYVSSTFAYKGFMLSNVPNLFVAGGYTNASWTLKVDLTNKAACRLISYMRNHNKAYCQPEYDSQRDDMKALPLLDLTSTYIQRDIHEFPKQSTFLPWRLRQNYLYDKYLLEYATLLDQYMKFYEKSTR